MNYRNANYNGNGGIDCEIEHPVHGWIPFTATPDDVEELGRTVFETAKTDAAPYIEPTPDPVAVLAAAKAAVNAERDRRLGLDFEFNGVMFQRDPVSVARISGVGTLALGAIVSGAQPGDLRWHGGTEDFVWIASDNSVVPMDAQTTFAFGKAAANIESLIVFAAKSLRGQDPIPEDYASDVYWP